MEKKLTLNQTWKYCLQMWGWIARQIKRGTDLDVYDLKEEWMRKHLHLDDCECDCFFCEYRAQLDNLTDDYPPGCENCPGKLVNKRFDCENKTYDYAKKPLKFYKKLLQLNEKRKTKSA